MRYTHDGFEAVIGLEVHCQLETKTKLFTACPYSYGEEPNSQTEAVTLALPGALPVCNRAAVDYAMRMILAVGGTVHQTSIFARKNYFYPDLPKGYQISQFDRPIGTGGSIDYQLDDGTPRSVGLIRIHLEEDAGKSLHPEGGENFTRVDLNRSGTPLIEIVSEPDIVSPQDAYAYLNRLKQIVQYLEICTGDMEKGQLRCDANVSVRPIGESQFGTRTELKNLNSFKGVERALLFEIERQVKVIKSGGAVIQSTLLWNEQKQEAIAMRGKEESHDYRYFPEPDLFPLIISDEWLAETRSALPELPAEKAARFVAKYGIRVYDATVLTDSRALADYYETVMTTCEDSVGASNWIQTELLGALKKRGEEIVDCPVPPGEIADLLNRVKSSEISGKIAKTVFAEMLESGKSAASIIKEKGLVQISDPSQLEPVIAEIIAANGKQVEAYRGGKVALFGFFVGQVMKQTRGQANPQIVNDLLKKALDT